MNYSSGNSLVPSASTPSSSSDVTTTTSFQGGGTISSGTSMNWGGPTGITIQGNQGMWAGAQAFADALTSFDLQGNFKAVGGTFSGAISGATVTGSEIIIGSSTGDHIDLTTGGVGTAYINFYDSSDNYVGSLFSQPGIFSIEGGTSGTINVSAGGVVEAVGAGGWSVVDSSGHSIGISPSTGANIHANTTVYGNLLATGTKSFDIPYPNDSTGKRLQYICPESPEVLVMCRGMGAVPNPPQNFLDIAEPNTIQYVIGDDGSGGKNWIATATRLGYTDFNPVYQGKDTVATADIAVPNPTLPSTPIDNAATVAYNVTDTNNSDVPKG